MDMESNDVRKNTIRRLRQELVVDVELANNLLFELNRYPDQLRTRAPDLLKAEALPDHPLIKYGFSAIEKASFTDMTNSNNLLPVMEVVREYPADERTAATRTGFVGPAGVPGGVAGMSNGLGLCRRQLGQQWSCIRACTMKHGEQI
nr:hypothetical protein [Tanacetum cinerariifolium]